MPVRKIPKNYRNVTGRISTDKSPDLLSFESKLERDFFLIFDMDNTVVSIEDQPFKIEFRHNDKLRSYTPDVYLQRKDGYPDIIGEIKYDAELKEKFPELKHKFRAAIDFTRTLDKPTEFRLFTNRCPIISNSAHIFNIHFLEDYKRFSHKDYLRVEEVLYEGATIQDVLDMCFYDRIHQMEFIVSIYAMIRRGIMKVDLTKKISTSMVIEELIDWEDVV